MNDFADEDDTEVEYPARKHLQAICPAYMENNGLKIRPCNCKALTYTCTTHIWSSIFCVQPVWQEGYCILSFLLSIFFFSFSQNGMD